MTKLRAPLSFEDAITRIAGRLGWKEAARVIGYEERTLRAFSDPDDYRQLALADALRLELAYVAAGAEDTPMLDAFAFQLDVGVRTSTACSIELTRRIAAAAREGGEAVAALVNATLPGATIADRAIAQRELRQSIDAQRAVLPLLETEAPP